MTRRAAVTFILTAAALCSAPPLVMALSATLFTKSTLADEANVNNDRIRFKTKDRTDVHVQEARFAPGDVVDWHNHPGFALIAVKSGTMTFYDADCRAHTVGPGQSLVESGGPTRTANLGDQEAVFYVTYVVPEGAPRTEPVDPPPCA
jgi:quercetin dioxygenase-like cupin family protein